jgi:hypothetical protein
MSEYYLVVCDKCNPNARIPNLKPTLTEEGVSVIVDRGSALTDIVTATEEHGWEIRDYGEICNFCAKEEELEQARAAEEKAETYVGENPLVDKLIEGTPAEEETVDA